MKVHHNEDGFVVGVQFMDDKNQILQHWKKGDYDYNLNDVVFEEDPLYEIAGREGDGEPKWIQTQGPIQGHYMIDDGGIKEFGLRVADPCKLYSSNSLVYDGSNSLQVLGYPENSYAAWHTI